ncbi:hypothetical protein BJ166DRAFT_515420 [Pestalotiopsis sp. NC0098]|nr:hypothetical protein BJ166DRAFT_515420 [Pestalotiopsis sp. NC0098]
MSQTTSAAVTGGKTPEYAKNCSELMVSIFQDDPLFNWFLHSTPETKKLPHLQLLIEGILRAASIGGGLFTEVGGFGASAALLPPGCKPDGVLTVLRAVPLTTAFSLGLQVLGRVVLEYTSATEKVKSKAMSSRDIKDVSFWYIVLMGTSLERRRQGLAGKLLDDVKARAQSDGKPVWLEATTPESRKLYLKNGFEDVVDINLGKGVVNAKGYAAAGGPGITIWAMIWRPVKATANEK